MFTLPSVDDFKALFTRDFPYGGDSSTVTDDDITTALADAGFNFNPGLFSTQDEYSRAFLLLSAHFLCSNLQASSQGIAGQYNWLTGSKGVGSISEGYSIPSKILENPTLAMYSKTRYGAKYIMFILPRLIAPIFTVEGLTKP